MLNSPSFRLGVICGVTKEAYTVDEPRPAWQRPVSSTIGRLPAALPWLLRTHPEMPFKKWTPERRKRLQHVLDAYEKVMEAKKDEGLDEEEAKVYLGSDRPFGRLARTWKRSGIGLPGKLLGTLQWPFASLLAPILRSDFYDPYANTVTQYTPDWRVLAHQLGHERDWARRDLKTLYALGELTPANIYQDRLASSIAPMVLEEMKKTAPEEGYTGESLASVTSPLFGATVGSWIGGLGAALPIVLRIVKLPAFKAAAPEQKKELLAALAKRRVKTIARILKKNPELKEEMIERGIIKVEGKKKKKAD